MGFVMRGIILTLLCSLVLSGCRTEYIPLETVRYDSLFFARMIHDSVYVRDSVYIHVKGDTVIKNKDKYVYIDRIKVDTFYVDRWRDRDVPVPVERKLSWWEKVKMDFGGWSMMIVTGWSAIVLLKWIIKRTRKK